MLGLIYMEKPTVIVTGCGFKPLVHVYKYNGKPTHNSIDIDGVEHKMNIGTAIAYYLTKKGIEVIMVSRNKQNLEKIKKGLVNLGSLDKHISYIATDITTDEGIDDFIKNLPKDKNYYWVQSIGMGGGAYKIPNDNIYLPFEQITPELITAEANIVPASHRLMLKMIPIFRRQIKEGGKAKISFITSMSGERGYHYGATHVAAKHALVGYIKGIEKELEDEGIEIHDIRPGGIDTGMYDNEFVRKSVKEISERTQMWGGKEPIFAEPIRVAEAVYDSLFSDNPEKVYRILAPEQV
jgi:short-subunit dehydrogenase